MASDVRSRVLGYLRDGDVAVVHARSNRDGTPPTEVVATVNGHRARYVIDFLDGAWSCTCSDWAASEGCAHIAAVQFVTGHPSAAAREKTRAA